MVKWPYLLHPSNCSLTDIVSLRESIVSILIVVMFYCIVGFVIFLTKCWSICRFINPLELDTEYVIEGIKVTMLEANHCPGAALILFHLADGRRVLHTGDFRACKLMQSYPLLVNQHIHSLHLDTTCCNAKYT